MKILSLAGIIIIFAFGCGILEKNDESKTSDVAIGQDVQFSGFVQRAFDIKVNDKSFSDTEDFYTRFIDELILSNAIYAERFKNSHIEVEGEYGLELFGSQAPAFMSSMLGDGHVFQTRTDNQGKFTIKVTKNAQDEIFKSRIIVRIGLLISNADQSKEHFCYILYGYRENISINENSKPIIFDEYKTQLNSYNCSDVSDSEIVIPESKSGAVEPVDDVNGFHDEDGQTKIPPYLRLKDTVKIASPLRSNEDGTNLLEAVTYDPTTNALFIVKGVVRDTGTGEEYKPVVKLVNLSAPTASYIEAPKSIAPLADTYEIQSIVPSGAEWLVQNKVGLYKAIADWTTFTDIDTTLQGGVLVQVSNAYKHLYNSSWCDLDFNSSTVEKNCKTLPSSNPHKGTTIVYAFVRSGLVHSVFSYSNNVVTYNTNGVSQGEYVIPKIQIDPAELKAGSLFFDGTNLNVVSLKSNDLVIKKLEFVEEAGS